METELTVKHNMSKVSLVNKCHKMKKNLLTDFRRTSEDEKTPWKKLFSRYWHDNLSVITLSYRQKNYVLKDCICVLRIFGVLNLLNNNAPISPPDEDVFSINFCNVRYLFLAKIYKKQLFTDIKTVISFKGIKQLDRFIISDYELSNWLLLKGNVRTVGMWVVGCL